MWACLGMGGANQRERKSQASKWGLYCVRSQIPDIGSYSCWGVNEEPFSNKMRLSNLEGKKLSHTWEGGRGRGWCQETQLAVFTNCLCGNAVAPPPLKLGLALFSSTMGLAAD